MSSLLLQELSMQVLADHWSSLDAMIDAKLALTDPALEEALRASDAAGLPQIQVSPAQGKLLHLIARMRGAHRILEIGTLGGYSTIWLARALPATGALITLELMPAHAQVARANLDREGPALSTRVEIRTGPALASLDHLIAERYPPFDLVFIDADKAGIPEYFERSIRLSKPGTVIVVDNVIRRIADPAVAADNPDAAGLRRFIDHLGADPRVSSTIIQTVGAKGHDGFALAIVLP